MKFGKYLEEARLPQYRDVYIDYKRYKKLLKVPAGAVDSSGFVGALQDDVDRVGRWVADREAELAAESRAVADARRATAARDAESRRRLLERAQAVWALSQDVTQVAETCYTTCYKAIKKHDKVTARALQAGVLAALDRQRWVRRWVLAGGEATGGGGSGGGDDGKPPPLLTDALYADESDRGRGSFDTLGAPGVGVGDSDEDGSEGAGTPARSGGAPTRTRAPAPRPPPLAPALRQPSASPSPSRLSRRVSSVSFAAPTADPLPLPLTTEAALAQFDALAHACVGYATEALAMVSPELAADAAAAAPAASDPSSPAPPAAARHAVLAALTTPLDELRAGVAAAGDAVEAGAAPPAHLAATLLRARLALFPSLARALLAQLLSPAASASPEAGAAVEHLLQLHALAARGADGELDALAADAAAGGGISGGADAAFTAWLPPATPLAALTAAGGAGGSRSRGASTFSYSGGGLASPSTPSAASTAAPYWSTLLAQELAAAQRDGPQATGADPATRSRGGSLVGDLLLRALGIGPDEGDDDNASASSSAAAFNRPPRGAGCGARTHWVLVQLWRAWRPAAFDWLPGYKLPKHLLADVAAGVTIGVLLIPQGLAYATLAGLPPYHGLYTGLPVVAYALLGTSRQAAIGPQSIPCLLIASSVGALSPPLRGREYVDAVLAVTLMVGILLLAMGWLRLGFIVRFISRPVLSGFAAGSAVLTMGSSVKALLGAPVPRGQVLTDYVVGIARALPKSHWPTAVTSLLAVCLLLALPRAPWSKAVPAPLQVTALSITILAATMLATGNTGVVTLPPPEDAVNGTNATRYEGPGGIELVGRIPSSLQAPSLPALPWHSAERMLALGTTALTVAFVGFIESVSVAQTYAVAHGYEVSPSSELKALGATNILGSALGAFPVMGAFGRSSVNDSAGARSPLAQAVSAATVLVLTLLVTPALFYLPQAVLAAIIVVAVSGLIDVRGAISLWRYDRVDALCLLASFAATLLLGVLYGVVIAIGFSLVLFIAAATAPRVEELGRVSGSTAYAGVGAPGVARLRTVKALRFHSPLWFANAAVLRDRLGRELLRRSALPPRLQWGALLLDCSSVPSADSTSVGVLREVIAQAHAARVPLLLSGCNRSLEATLNRAGLVAALGGDAFVFRSVHDAVRAVAAREVTAAMLPSKPVVAGKGAAPGSSSSSSSSTAKAVAVDDDDAAASAARGRGWWGWLRGGTKGTAARRARQRERLPLLASSSSSSSSRGAKSSPSAAPADDDSGSAPLL